MSTKRNIDKFPNKNSLRSSRNSSKPYDRNQSFLSRVKNAVKGYFTPPSWIQAVLSTSNAEATSIDTVDEDGLFDVEASMENSLEHNGYQRTCPEVELAKMEDINEGHAPLIHEAAKIRSKAVIGEPYEEKIPSLKRTLSKVNLGSKHSENSPKESHPSEPVSKRQALERNVEFYKDSFDSGSRMTNKTLQPNNNIIDLSIKNVVVPEGRPSIRQMSSSKTSLSGIGPGFFSNNRLPMHSRPSTPNSSLFSLSTLNKHSTGSSLASPFYDGPTTYGGANAHHLEHKQSDNKIKEDQHLLVSAKHSNLGLSRTTQKILKVLERKVPSYESDNKIGLPPLTYEPMKKSLLGINCFSAQGPPVKQIQTPSRLTVKPNYALMNFSYQSKENDSCVEMEPKMTWSQSNSQKWTGKMKRERDKLHEVRDHDDKRFEIGQHVNTADLSHIKLPSIKITPFNTAFATLQASNFDEQIYKFSLPNVDSTNRSSIINKPLFSKDFTFSQPKMKNPSQPLSSSSPSPPSPTVTNTLSINPSTRTSPVSLNTFNVDYSTVVRKSSSSNTEGLKLAPVKEMKQGSVMDVLKQGASLPSTPSSIKTHQSSTENKLSEVPLQMLFKSQAGSTWECPTCLVSNKNELSSCPCCSTLKPTPLSTTSPTLSTTQSFKPTSSIPTTSSLTSTSVTSADPITKPEISIPLSALFKQNSQVKWKCPTCMVENSTSLSLCPCCSEPRAGATSSVETVRAPLAASRPVETSKTEPPSLAALFAAKPGEWKCDVCMVKNNSDADKCVACETHKPGATRKKTSDESKKDFKTSVSAPSQISINSGTGGFKFGSGLTIDASDFGNKSKSTNADALNQGNQSSGGFKPSFGSFGSLSTPSSNTGFAASGGGFQFGLTASQSLSTSATPSISTFSANPTTFGNVTSAPAATSSGFSSPFTFTSSASIASASSFTQVSAGLNVAKLPISFDATTFNFGQVPSSEASSFLQGNENNSNSQTFFTSTQSGAKLASVFSFTGSSSQPKVSSTTNLGFGSLTNLSKDSPGVNVSSNHARVDSFNLTFDRPNNSSHCSPLQSNLITDTGNTLAFSFKPQQSNLGSFQVGAPTSSTRSLTTTTTTSNAPPFFTLPQSQSSNVFGPTSISSGTLSTDKNIFTFGPTSSSSSSIFGQNSCSQQKFAPVFGQTTQAQSLFPQSNTITNSTPQSGFSFNIPNSTASFGNPNVYGGVPVQSAQPLFGSNNANTSNQSISFGFVGTKRSISGDDMMTENDPNTPPPAQSLFGTSNTNDSNVQGFGFSVANNNSTNPFGVANQQSSQGFAFKAPPANPSFNFPQNTPNFSLTQQAPAQPWGQPSMNVPQSFSFNATPTFNFTGSQDTTNITFNASGATPGMGGNRIIKKAARRIPKK